MNTDSRVTIKDVAKRAGVTPAIVSRVYHKDLTLVIREETREEVEKAIRDLCYTPRSSTKKTAQAKRSVRTGIIGVIISDLMNPFFTEVVKGIQTAADSNDFSIVLFDTWDDMNRQREYIEIADRNGTEGLILGSMYLEDRVVEYLNRIEMKYVMVNRISANSDAPCVRSNDVAGMMLSVKHLSSLGHKRIAHLCGPLYADTGIRRMEGFRKGLLEESIRFDPRYVLETKFDEETGYQACRNLLALQDRPTAICASNDLVAIGAMRAVHERGWKVPEDISIIGYNDIWVASKLNPPLTTIRTPLSLMGESAFQLLFDLIAGRTIVDRRIIIEPELVVRGSTGPAKNAK